MYYVVLATTASTSHDKWKLNNTDTSYSPSLAMPEHANIPKNVMQTIAYTPGQLVTWFVRLGIHHAEITFSLFMAVMHHVHSCYQYHISQYMYKPASAGVHVDFAILNNGSASNADGLQTAGCTWHWYPSRRS